MKNFVLSIAILVAATLSYGQSTKVLFIGNSYTGVNDLPMMTFDVAQSTGDTLIIESHMPGGTRLMDHASSQVAISMINSKDWNYVVLQAQSQEPSWPIGQVTTGVFPYAKSLCDTVRANYSCSMPVFYMTWGRKYGDSFNCPNWPPVCTYEGMDSLLSERYQTMAEDNNALVSPVGAVWKHIRSTYPQIELYSPDESHPSMEGTYAAACTFYTVFLRKDPTQIMFEPGIDPVQAENIRDAVKLVVFDSLLTWNVGEYDPAAQFTVASTPGSPLVSFTNQSTQALDYLWNFGDGDTSTAVDPTHTYTPGVYTVLLTANNCNQMDTVSTTVNVVVSGIETNNRSSIKMYPNPATTTLFIELGTIDQESKVNLELFDVTGKRVLDSKINSPKKTIDVTQLPRGMYTYKVGGHSGNIVLQ